MASRIQQVAAAITAVGQATPWIKHSYFQSPFNVSLSAYAGYGLNASFSLEYVADDQSETSRRPVTITQATTVITVTDSGPQLLNGPFGHGLEGGTNGSGDYVRLDGTQAGVDGDYTVASVTNANVYTLSTAGVSQTLTATQAQVRSGRIQIHPALTALAMTGPTGTTAGTRTTVNYDWGVWMSRLICTAYTASGSVFLVAIQGDNP